MIKESLEKRRKGEKELQILWLARSSNTESSSEFRVESNLPFGMGSVLFGRKKSRASTHTNTVVGARERERERERKRKKKIDLRVSWFALCYISSEENSVMKSGFLRTSDSRFDL